MSKQRTLKLGDRVRRINSDLVGTHIGAIGTVVDVSESADHPDVLWDCGPRTGSYASNLEPIQPVMITPTLEQIKAAAKTSPEARKALEELFPEIKEPEAFVFKDMTGLREAPSESILPFFIGTGYAPPGMRYKCLVVSDDYHMEESRYDGRQILTFSKKS